MSENLLDRTKTEQAGIKPINKFTPKAFVKAMQYLERLANEGEKGYNSAVERTNAMKRGRAARHLKSFYERSLENFGKPSIQDAYNDFKVRQSMDEILFGNEMSKYLFNERNAGVSSKDISEKFGNFSPIETAMMLDELDAAKALFNDTKTRVSSNGYWRLQDKDNVDYIKRMAVQRAIAGLQEQLGKDIVSDVIGNDAFRRNIPYGFSRDDWDKGYNYRQDLLDVRNWYKQLPIDFVTPQEIEADPVSYTDHVDNLVRDYARKLISGEQ